jgi:hypothetical protein
MEKGTYYVNVDMGARAGDIRTVFETDDAMYDYEIRATREEIDQLRLLFEQMQDIDWKTFALAHTPYLDNESEENLQVDQILHNIYRMIYQLGTEETRKKLEQAGLVG